MVMEDVCKIDTQRRTHPIKVGFMESNRAKDFLRELTDAAQEEESKEHTKSLSYVERGNLYHYILSQVKLATDLHQVVQKAMNEGMFPSMNEAQSIEKLLQRRLADPSVAPWLDGSCSIYTECSLLERSGGEVIVHKPDRVMKKDNKFIVVDYKFASYREEYVQQVRLYIRTLEKMSHSEVEGYLWFVYKGEVLKVTL